MLPASVDLLYIGICGHQCSHSGLKTFEVITWIDNFPTWRICKTLGNPALPGTGFHIWTLLTQILGQEKDRVLKALARSLQCIVGLHNVNKQLSN